MRKEMKEVRTGGKVVAQVEVPIYENVDELIATESEERILSMFNKQNDVRVRGNERVKHTLTKIGKTKRFEIAYNLLWDILTPEEANEVVGNIERLKETIASERVQTAVDAYIEEQRGGTAEEASE